MSVFERAKATEVWCLCKCYWSAPLHSPISLWQRRSCSPPTLSQGVRISLDARIAARPKNVVACAVTILLSSRGNKGGHPEGRHWPAGANQ